MEIVLKYLLIFLWEMDEIVPIQITSLLLKYSKLMAKALTYKIPEILFILKYFFIK